MLFLEFLETSELLEYSVSFRRLSRLKWLISLFSLHFENTLENAECFCSRCRDILISPIVPGATGPIRPE